MGNVTSRKVQQDGEFDPPKTQRDEKIDPQQKLNSVGKLTTRKV